MRYAKVIDNKIEYITNVAIGEDLIEFSDTIKYPVYLNGKIVEGYNEDIANYLQGNISLEDIKQKLIEKLKEKYIQEFKKTDDLIIMRNKRMILDIWTEEDEQKFQTKMQEYKNLVLEYRQRKQDCLNLADDKQELINYYNTILLPRLEELNNGL